MLVEHSFVTTLTERETMDLAALFLQRVGLRHSNLASTSKPNKNLYRGLSGEFIPKKVQLGFDRGRVNAAIAIQPKQKARQVHRDVLLALVGGLERMIADGQSEDQAAQPWQAVIDQERKRVRRRTLTMVGVLLSIAGLFIGLVWLAGQM